MANVTVPPLTTERKEIPNDIYEAFIKEVTEEPNRFYNPDKPNEGQPTQLVWTITIREDGEYRGQNVRYYTGPSLGRHSRNKLTNLCKVIDKEFNIDVAYKDWDNFVDRVVNKPLRVTTELTPRKEGEGSYAKVTGILPTKMGDVSAAELMQLVYGATGTDF